MRELENIRKMVRALPPRSASQTGMAGPQAIRRTTLRRATGNIGDRS